MLSIDCNAILKCIGYTEHDTRIACYVLYCVDYIITPKHPLCSGFANRHVFTGLNALTQYKYRVRAANDLGLGPWSEVVTVATPSKSQSSM